MALDGPPSGPNVDSSFLYRQQMQGIGGSGRAPILMGLSLDVNVGSQLSVQNVSPLGKNLPTVIAQGRPGLFAKLCEGMGFTREEIFKGLKQCGDAGAVQQASIDQITCANNGLPSGGGGRGSCEIEMS